MYPLAISHSFILFITASSLLLAACTPTDLLESSLQEIQSILITTNKNNTVQYQLSYDTDFPCNSRLQENWKSTDNNNWQHNYRFDLTNIESNTFVQAKSGRRAIVYDGHKITPDGTKKIFSEKRINNIRFRATIIEKNQRLILDEMNKAIELCEEKYSFESSSF